MNERRHRPGVVGPLILITIGVLLLLNQMGRLSWDLWGTLWRFWPVIFILIGLDMLVSASRSTLVYILGLLAALAVIGGVIFYAVWQGGQLPAPGPSAFGTETLTEPLHDAASGRITLRPGVARIEIGVLADSPNLVEGTIEYGRYSLKATRNVSVVNGRAEFSLQGRGRSNTFWWPSDNRGEGWTLRFTPRIPLEFTVQSGVGNVDIDLSGLKVTQLDLSGGVGNTSVTFPATSGTTRASIDSGVGNIRVRIPEGVGARVRIDKGLGNLNVRNNRLSRSGNDYVSSNYDTAANKLELDINGGVGNITIE
jgi:hypothetical protein